MTLRLLAELVVPGAPIRRELRAAAVVAFAGHDGPASTAVRLHLRFFLPIAPDLAAGTREAMRVGLLRPSTRDFETLQARVVEAIEGVAFIDRRLIVEFFAERFYSEDPRTEVRVSAL